MMCSEVCVQAEVYTLPNVLFGIMSITMIYLFRATMASSGPAITFHRTLMYSETIADNLWEFQTQEAFTDFHIITEEKKLPCHRVLLAAISPVLRAAILADMTEAKTNEIKLHTVDTDTMEVVLEYMYKGEASIDPDMLWELTLAADYLQITDLKQQCVSQISTNIKLNNVLYWDRVAQQLDLHKIKAECLQLIMSSFMDIAKTEEYLGCSFSEVQDYFSRVIEAHGDRDKMLMAGMEWINHDASDRIKHLEDLLNLVDLENCTKTVLRQQMEANETLLCASETAQAIFVSMELGDEETDNGEAMQQGNQVLAIVGGNDIDGGRSVNYECRYANPPAQRMLSQFTKIPLEKKGSSYGGSSEHMWHSVCKTQGGFAVTGGEGSDVCLEYIVSLKSWIRHENMIVARHCHGSIFFQKRLYVLGGSLRPSFYSESVHCLGTLGMWQQCTNMPVKIWWPKVASIHDKTMYVLDAHFTNKLFELSEDGKAWHRRAPFPGRQCLEIGIVAAMGRLYVAGGDDPPMFARYTPTTDTWCLCDAPHHMHMHSPLVYFNKHLLIVGGNGETEEYDEEEQAWKVSKIKGLPQWLDYHYAVVLTLP